MTIIHKPDKRKGAAAAAGDAQPAPAASRVDRKVANCLCCGKVYQLLDGSSDVKALIGEKLVLRSKWLLPMSSAP